MEEVRYMISEAAKRVDVEAHVLRNWQKELALPISRNEMDQRYYKESDIELLKRVKYLKEQGFQLKAIKMILENNNEAEAFDSESAKQEEGKQAMEQIHEDKPLESNDGTSLITEEKVEIKEDANSKMEQFRAIMNHIIVSALKENNEALAEEVGINVTDGVIREMNYLMRIQEEREEERFKKFDAALRDYQKGRQLAAATTEHKKKKSKFFRKNKVYI
ncbi:MAG TPA: MerR family transcriptional regulator [Clostridiales bacterium]|nr:MerR family transcriptional regulator [Clostridiales bacterium]